MFSKAFRQFERISEAFCSCQKKGKFVVVRLRINGEILSLTLNFVELMKEKRKRHLYDEKTVVA